MNPLNILLSFPFGVAVFDRDQRAVFINPAFGETFGISAGGGAPGLLEKAPAIADHLERLFSQGTSYVNHDFPLGDPGGGRTITLSIHAVDYGGPRTGACIVARESPGRDELNREFEKEGKLEALSMITAGLAHEIKNPLSGIRGAAQLIGKEHKSLEEYSRLIIAETDRINGLVGELLEMGGARKRKQARTNVHRILDDILALRETVHRKGKVEVLRDYDPSLPPIMADADRLKQTFVNLIKNAAEAMPGGGPLRVRTRTAIGPPPAVGPNARRGMMMSVEIIDAGKGLDPRAAKNLFTPFNSTKSRGTGLGLVLSLKAVRDHGGVLTLENNPSGRGAVARVLLPIG